MTLRVALIAEASQEIGTGHVVEMFALARRLASNDAAIRLFVNAATPKPLLDHAPGAPAVVAEFDHQSCRRIAERLATVGCDVVVLNLRQVSNEHVRPFVAHDLRVVCIDELGNRRLDCDAVINNLPVSGRHRYVSDNPRFAVYAGPEYMALGSEYEAWHLMPRTHAGSARRVAIAFGGTDRIGTTVKVAESLLQSRDLELHIVLGGGFQRRGDLERLVAVPHAATVRLYHNLPSLADLLATCDVGFTAGGNTFYELACVGTPAVALHEEPHEAENARACETLGFGRWIGAGAEATAQQIRSALGRLDDPRNRQAESDIGRQLVDGRGASRIEAIVRALPARVRCES